MMFQKDKQRKLNELSNRKGKLDLNDLFCCEIAGEELSHYIAVGFLIELDDGYYKYVGPKNKAESSYQVSDFSKKIYESAVRGDFVELTKVLSTKNNYSSLENAIVKLLGVLNSLKEGDSIPIVHNKFSTSFIQAIFKYDFYQALFLLKQKEQSEELTYLEKTILILLNKLDAEIILHRIHLPREVDKALETNEEKKCYVSNESLAKVLMLIIMEGINVEAACASEGFTKEQTSLVKLVLAKELMRNGRFAVADALVQEVKGQSHECLAIQRFLEDIEANVQNMKNNPKRNVTSLDVFLRTLTKSRLLKEKRKDDC